MRTHSSLVVVLAIVFSLPCGACSSRASLGGTDGGVLPNADASIDDDSAAVDAAVEAAVDAASLPEATTTDAADSVLLNRDSATAVAPLAFGQNYWSWVSSYGNQVE